MRLRRKPITWPALVAAGVVLAGTGTAYALAGGGGSPTYRTVTAVTGDVEQTLGFTGVVDAAKRSDLAFGTDGTVARVTVAQGDHVKAGQVIATLRTDDLDAAVTDAVATLARAKAALESDKNAQTSSVQNAAGSGGTGKPTGQPDGASNGQGGTGAPGSSAATAALLAKLRAEQDAVVSAQSVASAALAAAADALAAQTAACADAYQSPTVDPSPTADPSTTTSNADQNAACDAALADVAAKQAAVKQAQDDLADALNELSATLGSALGSLSGPQPSAARQSTSTGALRTVATTTQPTTQATTPAATQPTVTAARLASDQAQIDQARADLITARAARKQATLRSTRSGTVASLDLTRGDPVSTGTTVAVVVGGKAVTLTGAVAEASIGEVEVGQHARVSVPGSSATTDGAVTAIGLTADTSTGSTTYPVTVTVEDPAIALPTGSRAQVSIVLSTATGVVTVPISAITRNGENATVRIWDGKTLQRRSVTLGAVGARSVAITDGVAAGTKLVVADVDQAISGASSQLDQRGGFNGPPGGGQFTFRQRAGGGGPSFSKAG